MVNGASVGNWSASSVFNRCRSILGVSPPGRGRGGPICTPRIELNAVQTGDLAELGMEIE